MDGCEVGLWQVLRDRWLAQPAAISAPVLHWLVHNHPPAHTGIDITWPQHPHSR